MAKAFCWLLIAALVIPTLLSSAAQLKADGALSACGRPVEECRCCRSDEPQAGTHCHESESAIVITMGKGAKTPNKPACHRRPASNSGPGFYSACGCGHGSGHVSQFASKPALLPECDQFFDVVEFPSRTSAGPSLAEPFIELADPPPWR